jgi:hypothetical protein
MLCSKLNCNTYGNTNPSTLILMSLFSVSFAIEPSLGGGVGSGNLCSHGTGDYCHSNRHKRGEVWWWGMVPSGMVTAVIVSRLLWFLPSSNAAVDRSGRQPLLSTTTVVSSIQHCCYGQKWKAPGTTTTINYSRQRSRCFVGSPRISLTYRKVIPQ